MLAPNPRWGSLGSCCAEMSVPVMPRTTAMYRATTVPAPLPGLTELRRLRPGLPLGKNRVVFLVGQVNDVHPGVRHFIDGPVAVADPLVRIGIERVRPRVVMPRGHVDDRPLGEDGRVR